MLTRRTYGLYLGIPVAVLVLARAGFVPAWMSGQTLGWETAVVIGLFAVALLAMRSGQPTRSVAHVLYDAEQQKGLRR